MLQDEPDKLIIIDNLALWISSVCLQWDLLFLLIGPVTLYLVIRAIFSNTSQSHTTLYERYQVV